MRLETGVLKRPGRKRPRMVILLAQQTGDAALADAAARQLMPWLFYGFALLTVMAAWAIVISQNIVRMSVYLLLALGGVAGLYFLLLAELLAAIQLIVYVGGTLILIVFGVMLTSRNPFMQLQTDLWERAVGVGLGLVVAGLLLLALVTSDLPARHTAGLPGDYTLVETFGRVMLSKYVVVFELAAVLLLVVMIGAAYMARQRSTE
jgi:NADH-quinone oxidoreductase subunit J